MVGHWLGRLITLQHTTEHDTALEKTVRRCPDLYHEVFNEPKRNEVLTAEPNAFSGLNGSRQGRLTRRSPLNTDGCRCAVFSGQADLSAGLFQLGLGGLGLVLRHTLQQRLGRTLDEVLGLLETQPGDDLPDHLDALDLLLADGLEDYVELVLLLSGRGLGGSPDRTRRHRDRRRGGDIKGLFELLHETAQLEQRHVLEHIEQLVGAQLRHDGVLLVLTVTVLIVTRFDQSSALSPAGCCSCSLSRRAAANRATWEAGSANSLAALERLACIAPASLASSTSRDSRSAIWV